MAQRTSPDMDELLAQSLAMQDYMDLMNVTPTNTNTNTTTNIIPPLPSLSELTNNNKNTNNPNTTNTNNNQFADHRLVSTTTTNTTTSQEEQNPNPPPKILNSQCLPSNLQNYICSKSIINLSPDISSINPDLHNLFLKYNYLYFDNKLSQCEVKWSKRMTLCAGLCCYEGQGGLCSIKLSSSLLKYRSTKEMIETLIHEMIHAFLFVTFNNRDRESHGDRFKTLMNVINYTSNLNISIYHTFHDEVDQFRKHIWKCNGPCQYKSPYFGLVKRAMNRAPGPRDTWWKRHEFECGGKYTKISEPKEFTEKQRKKKEREERRKLKEEMKRNGVEVKKEVKKKGRKRKRMDDKDAKKNGRTLLDMFQVSGKKKEVVEDEKKVDEEPARKRRRVDVDKGDDDGSDLEVLVVDDLKDKKDVVMTDGGGKSVVMVKCPICRKEVVDGMINEHLDGCLK